MREDDDERPRYRVEPWGGRWAVVAPSGTVTTVRSRRDEAEGLAARLNAHLDEHETQSGM